MGSRECVEREFRQRRIVARFRAGCNLLDEIVTWADDEKPRHGGGVSQIGLGAGGLAAPHLAEQTHIVNGLSAWLHPQY